MKKPKYDDNTFCQAYDKRCSGCIYEKRWNAIISKVDINERIALLKKMNALDPAICGELNMLWKEV